MFFQWSLSSWWNFLLKQIKYLFSWRISKLSTNKSREPWWNFIISWCYYRNRSYFCSTLTPVLAQIARNVECCRISQNIIKAISSAMFFKRYKPTTARRKYLSVCNVLKIPRQFGYWSSKNDWIITIDQSHWKLKIFPTSVNTDYFTEWK